MLPHKFLDVQMYIQKILKQFLTYLMLGCNIAAAWAGSTEKEHGSWSTLTHINSRLYTMKTNVFPICHCMMLQWSILVWDILQK